MAPPVPILSDGDRARLRGQLRRHEDERLRLYQDGQGKWTIGVGHNLTDRGISPRVSAFMLEDDIDDAIRWLVAVHADWFLALSPPRQAAIVNMVFNLGADRFSGFHALIAALRARHYDRAAAEMLASRWAEQVGARARELADMMRLNAWPTSPAVPRI